MTGAQLYRAPEALFAGPHQGVEIWHLTGNTPRQPDTPVAGEPVTLRFGVSAMQPHMQLCVVVENDRADALDAMPQIIKATRRLDSNGSSYWQCQIGPFEECDTVAYFAVGNWGGREIICGKQHWFRVCPPWAAEGTGDSTGPKPNPQSETRRRAHHGKTEETTEGR
jgi:hypothetical protein